MEHSVTQDRWYEDGLKFTCTQCGNCCTGSTGYIWTTAEERQRIAKHLDLELADFTKRYARRVGLKYSLKEKGQEDNWDCVFLAHHNGRHLCSIYPVRPHQCRAWPFWDENLRSPAAWQAAAQSCPGISHGNHHDLVQIEIHRNGRF